MTHEEKWKLIEELDPKISAALDEWRRLVEEKDRLLMTPTPPPVKRRKYARTAGVYASSRKLERRPHFSNACG